MTPQEPTSDQCEQHARVEFEGRIGFACFYPQMGGYHGKAVVFPEPDPDWRPGEFCFDVYVWHDGDFPFSGEGNEGKAHNPAMLHHCGADQFIEFGELVKDQARSLA